MQSSKCLAWLDFFFFLETIEAVLHTNILDKINPGINPASKGTRAVANDQVNTPISRTFLNQKKDKR